MHEEMLVVMDRFLAGEQKDVICDGKPYCLYFAGDSFRCETQCICHSELNRQHETISIIFGDQTFYGIDSLKLRSPKILYDFFTLSTEYGEIKFNNIILQLIKEPPHDHSLRMDFQLNNITYCGVERLQINSKIIKKDCKYYLHFTLNQLLSKDFIVGVALRIAHSISFLQGYFCAQRLCLLYTDSSWALTSSGNFDLKRPYTIFNKPYQYDFDRCESLSPCINDEFFHNIMKNTLENDYFYDILLMTIEKPQYNAYYSAVTCFVALEMFAQHNSEDANLPEEWKTQIKNLVPTINELLGNEQLEVELYEFLQRKISGFFNPLNTDRLKKACETVHYQLASEDEATLKLRNKFLHGNFTERDLSPSERLSIILRIHRLVCSLLAKCSGYDGYIFLYDQFLPTQGRDKSVEDIFRKI